MSSFFTDESSHKFGIINSSGNFVELTSSSENWKQEHGDVCVKLLLKARGGGSWNNLWKDMDKSPALLYVTLQISEDNTVWTDVKTFNIGLMDQIIDGFNSHYLGSGTVYEIEKDMYGNFMEIGDDIPRSKWYYTRLSFQCTYNPINELVKDYSSWGSDARYKANDPTPPDITSSHLATVKVASACNYDNYAAAFVGGSSTRTAELDITSSNFARPKFKVTVQLMNPENPTSNCSKYYYYKGGIPQANGNNGQMIRNSAEQNDQLKFQYSTNNGSTWTTAKTFYPDNDYVDEKSSGFGGVNVFRSFSFQANNKDRDNLKFRFSQSSSGGFNDMIIMDALKIYRPNYSSQFYWDERQYSSSVIILPGMFKFDTATLRLKSSDSSPSGLNPIISDFFKIEDTNSDNETITPGVTLAQVEADIKAESTQTHAFAGDQYEISRCSYIRVTVILNGVGSVVQNFEDREGSHILVAGENTGITSGDRSWYVLNTYPQPAQSMGKMVIDISSMILMHHLFTGGTFSVAFEAIGKTKNNTEFVIDSTASTITWSPVYNFDIAESVNPWNYITYPPPGKVGSTGQNVHDPFANYSNATPAAQSQIGINNIRIQSTETTASAVMYKARVYSSTLGWLTNDSVDGCADNGTLIQTGSDKRITLKQGTHWFNTSSNVNFYGTGSISDTGLSISTWAHQSTSQTNAYLEAYHTTNVSGNHRNKWTFKENYGINGSGMEFYPTINKEEGTWSIPNIVFYTTESNKSAFWFRIYVEHRANSSAGATKILDRWFPGCPTVPGQSLGGGGDTYFYQIDGFIEDARLNQYFTSVYDYPEDELKIRVWAYGNIPGNGSIAHANSDWMPIQQDYGLQPANLRTGDSFPQIARVATATTQTSFRLASTFDFTYQGGEYEAHYFRVDVYEDDPSIVAINDVPLNSENLLGVYYTYGVAGGGLYPDVAANDTDVYRNVFIKATGFSNFMGKANAQGNHVYGAINLSEFQNSLYTGGDYIVQMRAIADDGQYLPIRPFHGETESDNPTTDIRERFSYEPAQWTFAPQTSIYADTGGDRAMETFGDENPEDDYFIKVRAEATSSTRSMFDYITLDMSSSNGSMSVTLPSNGETYYYGQKTVYFTEDVNGDKINIKDLLNDRYDGTDVSWTMKAFAYGKDLTADGAELISEKTGTYTIWDWSWQFNNANTKVLHWSSNSPTSYYIKAEIQSTNTTDIADRFKVIITKDNNESKEFFLDGIAFDTAKKTYTTNSSNQYMNIVDLLNSGTYINRHNMHPNANNMTEFTCNIIAQRANGDGTYTDLANITNIHQPINVPFEFGDVIATTHYQGADKLTVKLQVKKQANNQWTNQIRIATTEQQTLSTNVNSAWEYARVQIATNQTLGNTYNASNYQTLYYDVLTSSTVIDRFDTTQVRIQLDNEWRSGNNKQIGGAIKGGIYLNVSPLAKVDSTNSSISLNTNTSVHKYISVNVRQTRLSNSTLNPTSFDLKFTRSDVASNLANSSQTVNITFAQASVDNNNTHTVNIEELYDNHFASANHNLTCEIIPKFSDGSVGDSVTKTISMLKEPKISFTFSTVRGMLLDTNGNEYLAVRFLPKFDGGYSGYLPNTENFTIDIDVKEDKNNSVIASRSYTLSGDKFATYLNATIPTGIDIYDDIPEDNNYYVEIKGTYDIVRTANTVNMAGDLQTLNDTNQFKMIYGLFPKNMESISHNFDANGASQLQFSFQKRDGQNTGYSNLQGEWSFVVEVTETVAGSVDANNHGLIEFTNNADISKLDVNAVPWSPKLPREANYRSDITVKIVETYSNRLALSNALTHFGTNLGAQAGESIPNWSTLSTYNEVARTLNFAIDDVVMNDLVNFPNTTVVPTNIVVIDIPGEYAAPYKRFTFDVPLDFDTYFTNAEPFFSFGLEVDYKDSSDNVHTSGPSYITDQGTLVKASEFSGLGSQKIQEMQNDSVYKVKDFGKEDGQYYFDLVLNQDGFDYDAQPSFNASTRRTAQYTLLVYIRDEVEIYGQEDKIITEPVAYSDINNWTKSVVKGNDETPDPDDWYADATIRTWKPIYSNYSVQPQTSDKTKFDYSFNFDIDDIKKKPYAFSQINPKWRGVVKTLGGAAIGNYFYSPHTYHYDGGEIAQTTYNFPMSNLNKTNFNPFEDIVFGFTPYLIISTKVKNSYLYGFYKTLSELEINHTLNYRDLIVPSFNELLIDNSLNEDTVNNNKTSFTNKVVWFYNKTALKDVTKVHTVSEEWVVIRRIIRQGEQVFDGGHEQAIPLYGTSVTRTNHDADTFKFTYTDSNVDLNPYTNSGLDGNKSFVFEYELTPAFRYGVNSETATMTEIPEKKISTFLIPDEFPYANNGVRSLSNNYVHENKHSIHLKWDYEYTESLDTFKALGAKISFELYWYVDETTSQKQVKQELKPRRRKLERIKNNQDIDSSWNFITSVDYEYPTEPTLGEFTKHSFLWKYDKLETDSNIRVVVLTKVESDIIGNTLSQTFGSRGVENEFSIDIKTSDKARKIKMHNDDELKRTPNRHLKREQEFTSSLAQVPFTVTRKKAKPRGSDKPYSSST